MNAPRPLQRMQLCVARMVERDLRCQRCDVLYSKGFIPTSNLCSDYCELCARLTVRLAGQAPPRRQRKRKAT